MLDLKVTALSLYKELGEEYKYLNFQGFLSVAGWSSLVARRAHNPKVVGSNPAPATKIFTFSIKRLRRKLRHFCFPFLVSGPNLGPQKK